MGLGVTLLMHGSPVADNSFSAQREANQVARVRRPRCGLDVPQPDVGLV